ncbi:MAG: hypothetical protein GY861_22595 [bacterium]|nr:hypothetical protein [bacterium]
MRRKTTKNSTIEDIYDYTTECGELLYQIIRFSPKDFGQRRLTKNGEYLWGITPGYYYEGDPDNWYKVNKWTSPLYEYKKFKGVSRKVLYNLPRVVESKLLIVVEGEKDATTANELGLPATTNSGGVAYWRKDFLPYLKGKDIIIIADNDPPGLRGARRKAKSVATVTDNIKLIESLPGIGKGGDLTDWTELLMQKQFRHTTKKEREFLRRQLLNIIEEAPSWIPGGNQRFIERSYFEDNSPLYEYKNRSMGMADILSLFNNVTQTSRFQWQACCPVHDDKVRSFGIALKGTKVVMNCLAGCPITQVLYRVGLKFSDLHIK